MPAATIWRPRTTAPTSPAPAGRHDLVRRLVGTAPSATSRPVLLVIAVIVAALVIAAAALHLVPVKSSNPIAAHPPPPLFPPTVVHPLQVRLDAEQARANRAFAAWATNHPHRDDAAFAAFALDQIPPPPDAAARARELDQVRQLATARTTPGVDAATWLELYGKTEVWKLYRHDYAELQPANQGTAAKQALKDTRALTKSITGMAQAKYGSDAPFITDPALRPDKAVSPGTHKLSYPSAHAVYCYSARTLLTHLDPQRGTEYDTMAAQVAYSRLYMAGHYRSDLITGAFLGDLIGDYVLTYELP